MTGLNFYELNGSGSLTACHLIEKKWNSDWMKTETIYI